MKATLSALMFGVVMMVVSGVAFQYLTLSATEAYSVDSARVGHQNPVDGRLGWAEEL